MKKLILLMGCLLMASPIFAQSAPRYASGTITESAVALLKDAGAPDTGVTGARAIPADVQRVVLCQMTATVDSGGINAWYVQGSLDSTNWFDMASDTANLAATGTRYLTADWPINYVRAYVISVSGGSSVVVKWFFATD